MAYINFPVATKTHRLNQVNTDLGATSKWQFYSGALPLSPDITVPAGNLLATLAGSATPGVVTSTVQGVAINNPGTGGTAGVQVVTGTTGTGTMFQASVLVAGGSITQILGMVVNGTYTVNPTSLVAEPVTGGALSGATLSLAMTAQLTFNAVTTANASATGTAGFVRLATSATAGAAGVIDLDIGGPGSTASVVINSLSLTSGTPVVVTATSVITET